MTNPTFKPYFQGGEFSAMYSWDGTTWVPATLGASDVDAFGSQQVVIYDSLGDPLLYTGSTAVAGDVADDGADSGNPVKVAGVAKAGLSGVTLVAANDRKQVNVGLDGSQFVRTVPLEDIVSGTATNTDGTITTVIAAFASGKQYLTRAIFNNSHATTTGFCALKSGTTARTISLAVPPGGAIYTFDPPLPPNAANEVWAFDPDAAVTTLGCTLLGFKSLI